MLHVTPFLLLTAVDSHEGNAFEYHTDRFMQ